MRSVDSEATELIKMWVYEEDLYTTFDLCSLNLLLLVTNTCPVS